MQRQLFLNIQYIWNLFGLANNILCPNILIIYIVSIYTYGIYVVKYIFGTCLVRQTVYCVQICNNIYFFQIHIWKLLLNTVYIWKYIYLEIYLCICLK